jgi:hypothetical protein
MMIARRGAVSSVLLGFLLVCSVWSRGAQAQGYGRGMGRHAGEGSAQRRQSDDPSAEISKRFEEMAEAKPVLKDVKLDHAQKDSVGRIEKTYQNRFLSYTIAAKHMFEDAKAQGTTPDLDQLQKLQEDARTLQDQEYAELRAVIAEDQRTKFDANVQRHREEDEKNERGGRRAPSP